MLWWFEREGRKTRIEVLNLATGHYELRVVDDDGLEFVEYFDDAAELAKRQQEIQDKLVLQGWDGPSSWIV